MINFTAEIKKVNYVLDQLIALGYLPGDKVYRNVLHRQIENWFADMVVQKDVLDAHQEGKTYSPIQKIFELMIEYGVMEVSHKDGNNTVYRILKVTK